MTTMEFEQQFKIRSALRCDGAGTLDCAQEVATGKRLAIRWLPEHPKADSAVAAARSIPLHPNLPEIRSTGEVDRAKFVAMDFPEGQLLSALPADQVSPDLVRWIGADMADALAALHHEGLVHGELGLDSVLILEGRRAVLWDVALVLLNRLCDRRAADRGLASLSRCAPFLSPEVAQGLAPSSQSDVYALGAALCLAGGSQAMAEATTLGVLHRVASGQWRPAVPPHYPEELRELLGRMLDADPTVRPPMWEVARVLAAPPTLGSAPKPIPAEVPPASVQAGETEPAPGAASAPAAPIPASAPPSVAPPSPAWDTSPRVVSELMRGGASSKKSPWPKLALVAAPFVVVGLALIVSYQPYKAEPPPEPAAPAPAEGPIASAAPPAPRAVAAEEPVAKPAPPAARAEPAEGPVAVAELSSAPSKNPLLRLAERAPARPSAKRPDRRHRRERRQLAPASTPAPPAPEATPGPPAPAQPELKRPAFVE